MFLSDTDPVTIGVEDFITYLLYITLHYIILQSIGLHCTRAVTSTLIQGTEVRLHILLSNCFAQRQNAQVRRCVHALDVVHGVSGVQRHTRRSISNIVYCVYGLQG